MGREYANRQLARLAREGWFGPIDSPAGIGFSHRTGLAVIMSRVQDERGSWCHISASYADRPPSDDDMATVRRTFVGPFREWEEEPNAGKNPNTRHIFARLEASPPPKGDRPDA